MNRFIVFVVGSLVSFLILKYRHRIRDFVGEIGFAERIFMTGGTTTFIVLVGFLVFVFTLMYAAGTLQGFLANTIGRIF